MQARSRMPRTILAIATLALPFAFISLAFAQPRAQHVPTPGRSAAASDDGSALVLNPANVSFMPGAELRWTWVNTLSGDDHGSRGHAFSLASALPFGLASGIRLDFVRPDVSEPETATPLDQPYTWLTWGLAFGGKASALGLSIRHMYSDEPGVEGPTTLSLGWSGRPNSYLGLAAVANDINSPKTIDGKRFVDRSYTLALALRPLATRSVELGVEGRYYEGLDLNDGQGHGYRFPIESGWVPRATLGLDVPYVGRLLGDVLVTNIHENGRSYVATATLDITAGKGTLSGGAIFGNAIGDSGGVGFITGIALKSWEEPGLPTPSYALTIRVEDTPSNRGHVAFVRKLWKISNDPEVAAVILHIKTSPASSLAHAYELDDAVRLLQKRGKRVVCHLEDAGGRAFSTCASADRIVMNPAGGLRFAGLRISHTYMADLLSKLGVRAQFVRIGKHKSAPEQLTNTAPSPTARADSERNLQQLTNELIALLAKGRKMSPPAMKKAVDKGPHTAREALALKLVNGYAYDDELRVVVSELLGRDVGMLDAQPTQAPEQFGTRRSLAIVYVDGNIIDGRSSSIPLLGMKLAGSYTIADSLKKVREDSNVGAVLLRVESPGGSSMASDVIWREVALTAKIKPVVVSMGGVAASGGYYVAAPGTKIYATPFTVTGSIGIFYGKADVAQLLQKIGVNINTIKTSPNADAESIYQPFTPEQIELLGAKVKQFYDVFIDRVGKGRKMSPDRVDRVARGRVWIGRKATEVGLVDEVGGIRQAIDAALASAGLPQNTPIVEFPPEPFSLVGLAPSSSMTPSIPSP
ncbi:MAG: signal peptide peptidase SppA [Sorangium cellulosum]|nr:MAG: signal peptide peptidase SppA [Sorangium cellulosum]